MVRHADTSRGVAIHCVETACVTGRLTFFLFIIIPAVEPSSLWRAVHQGEDFLLTGSRE